MAEISLGWASRYSSWAVITSCWSAGATTSMDAAAAATTVDEEPAEAAVVVRGTHRGPRKSPSTGNSV